MFTVMNPDGDILTSLKVMCYSVSNRCEGLVTALSYNYQEGFVTGVLSDDETVQLVRFDEDNNAILTKLATKTRVLGPVIDELDQYYYFAGDMQDYKPQLYKLELATMKMVWSRVLVNSPGVM